ncbi:MAG: hypothetical protein DRO13_06425 [Thermoprotei archaeon]|nr:MAG: hypothetical protein DRO13_06425 [Thermoprotei archaeon]
MRLIAELSYRENAKQTNQDIWLDLASCQNTWGKYSDLVVKGVFNEAVGRWTAMRHYYISAY